MVRALFNGLEGVANEEVIKKMEYFISEAEKGMELYKIDKKSSLELAKRLRRELEAEYNNNSLQRIERMYADHELFSAYYQPAVHQAIASISGPLSYKKLHGFLYDVEDYMRYYLPNKTE